MTLNKGTDSLVILGLGSNLGDSSLIICNAITVLKERLTELKMASLYETAPLHVTDQNQFINTAVSGLYSGTPGELLHYINYVEARFGRDREKGRRWGERLLDIDILLFGDKIVNEYDLVIPHAMLKDRRFALEPLLELLPDAIDPVSGLAYSQICQVLPDQGVKQLSK